VFLHAGNLLLRALVTDRLSEYEAAQYSEKQHISYDIVRTVHEQGGFFLKEEDSWWIEVDRDTARTKVRNHPSFRREELLTEIQERR